MSRTTASVLSLVCGLRRATSNSDPVSVLLLAATHTATGHLKKDIEHSASQTLPLITHAVLPVPMRKTARTPSKLHSTPPIVSLVMFLPRPFPRSEQRTRSTLASTTLDIVVTPGSRMQQRRSMFSHSELRLMRPNTGT